MLPFTRGFWIQWRMTWEWVHFKLQSSTFLVYWFVRPCRFEIGCNWTSVNSHIGSSVPCFQCPATVPWCLNFSCFQLLTLIMHQKSLCKKPHTSKKEIKEPVCLNIILEDSYSKGLGTWTWGKVIKIRSLPRLRFNPVNRSNLLQLSVSQFPCS